jgi:RNA polymerase sigma-70 factor (family 1)
MALGEYTGYEDLHLLKLTSTDDKRAFDALYARYFDKLFKFVYNRIHHKEDAEEILQSLFYSIWVKRATLSISTSVSAYLYGACKNLIIHSMRDEKVRKGYLAQLNFIMQREYDHSTENVIQLHDFEEAIERGLSGLPAHCKKIFKMSRQQNRSIHEIAEELTISHKTVENNLTTALKHLRVSLSEFMAMVLLAFSTNL